jgi:hypothetical protein
VGVGKKPCRDGRAFLFPALVAKLFGVIDRGEYLQPVTCPGEVVRFAPLPSSNAQVTLATALSLLSAIVLCGCAGDAQAGAVAQFCRHPRQCCRADWYCAAPACHLQRSGLRRCTLVGGAAQWAGVIG